MTEKEKQIYNTYIVAVRSKQNKPFKIRKDFAKFEEEKCYPYVKRLTAFFARYPHIVPKEFFEAPYVIHMDNTHINIDYYLSRAAIKVYSLYQKKLQDSSPESQIEFIRSSFQYIGMFCLKNKITLNEYLHHKTGCIYSWMLHYREHHISIYSLFELGDVLDIISTVPGDEKVLLLDDLQQTIAKFKVRYYNSLTVKQFVKEGTTKINDFLNKSYLQDTKTQP